MVAAVAVLIVVGLAYGALSLGAKAKPTQTSTGACSVLGGTKAETYQPETYVTTAPASTSRVNVTSFGAVSEYALPIPTSWPNAAATAPDGSVWFGEEYGLAHLFANGTLVQYSLSNIPGFEKSANTDGIVSWGAAVWEGDVWAGVVNQNLLVGLNPSDGSLRVVNLTGIAEFPYTLTVSPGGALWFTLASTPAKVGTVQTDLSVTLYSFDRLCGEEPLQMQFTNSTSGYFVALDPVSGTGAGNLYRFDLPEGGGPLAAVKVGPSLIYPDSLSVSGDTVWIAQHGPSSVVSYNSTSGAWTTWPTSAVPFYPTTLPYFIQAGSQYVWFNEHYANKIARLDPSLGVMTEYSEADPPVTQAVGIQNDLTIAVAPAGLWFTSATGNYVGFLNQSASPGFAVDKVGADSATVAENGTATFRLEVTGSWSGGLQVNVTDSEQFNGTLKAVSVRTSETVVPPGNGTADVSAVVTALPSLQPGRYTIAVTVGNGLVFQTAFFFLTLD